jgi:hypothetical protein
MTTKIRTALIVATSAGLLALAGVASAGPLDTAIKKLQEKEHSDQKSDQQPSTSTNRKSERGSSGRQNSSPPPRRDDRSRGTIGGVAPAPRSDNRDSRGGDRGRDQGPSHNLDEDLARLHGQDPRANRDRGGDSRGNDRDRNEFRDRNDYRSRSGTRVAERDRGLPRIIERLPSGHRDYYWHGNRYYSYGGRWYRPYGSSFIAIGIPFGLFVTTLPGYYTSFWFDGTRYFYSDNTYYVYDADRRGYVVSRSPYGDDNEQDADSVPNDELYVYPAKGQSEQQQADDRYECHRWAVDQTRYDPLNDQYDADKNADYRRAMIACLTGRGYTVN